MFMWQTKKFKPHDGTNAAIQDAASDGKNYLLHKIAESCAMQHM